MVRDKTTVAQTQRQRHRLFRDILFTRGEGGRMPLYGIEDKTLA